MNLYTARLKPVKRVWREASRIFLEIDRKIYWTLEYDFIQTLKGKRDTLRLEDREGRRIAICKVNENELICTPYTPARLEPKPKEAFRVPRLKEMLEHHKKTAGAEIVVFLGEKPKKWILYTEKELKV